MKNFKLIVEEIQRIMGQDTFSAQGGACPNVYEIAAGENIQDLILILKQCFFIAAGAPNNSIYIQKVMTLSEDSQILLAQLLRREEKTTPPTPKYT